MIRHYFGALTAQHNFLAQKLRDTPRSQDPTQAGIFTPESVGESSTLFEEWLFLKRLREPTDENLERITVLERLVPASIQLYKREAQILQFLARTVGEEIDIGLPHFALRPLLNTAIRRHHVKGSHTSFSLLGRIMGIFDLKVQELWTRATLTDPSNPSGSENNDDFSPVPEKYPYWPEGAIYSGVSRPQWPVGSEDYDPFELDDDPAIKTLVFNHLVLDRRSVRYYNTVLNEHNPFITIREPILEKLKPGTYTLTGGAAQSRATVSVPSISGGSVTHLDATALGSHGNSITVTVVNNQSGTQGMTLDGPQSTIKYKSSYFDLVFGLDLDAMYATMAAIPVETLPDATRFDVQAGFSVLIRESTSDVLDDADATALLALPTGDGDIAHEWIGVQPTFNVIGSGDEGYFEGDNPLPAWAASNFVYRAQGFVVIPETGWYTFGMNTDDGCKLSIDGDVVILDDSTHTVGDTYGSIYLTEGVHEVEAYFWQNSGGNSGELYAAAGEFTTWDSSMRLLGDVENGGLEVFTDGLTTRRPPDYPITGNVSGEAVVSNPATDWQMDFDAFNDLMTILRVMVERLRPMTRTIRQTRTGFVINDMMRYAPNCALNEVILRASDGSRWKLYLNEGEPAWENGEFPDSPDSPVLTQFDHGDGIWIEWRISAAGVFSAVASSSGLLIPYIVFLPGGTKGGFVFVRSRHLMASGVYEQITENIGGDGTPNEDFLSLDYGEFSESPSQYSIPFMSDDAVYDGAPPDCLLFQQVPEDEVVSKPTILDQDKFHVAAHFGTEDHLDGDINGNWWYDTDGQMNGTDLRLRAAGIDTNLIAPAPSNFGGDNGMTYGDPFIFLNYHGKYVYRDREDNTPKLATYTFDTVDIDNGPTLTIIDLPDHGDGPIEGGIAPDEWDPVQAMDGGLWDTNTLAPWYRYANWEFSSIGDFTALEDQSGKMVLVGFDTSASPTLLLGSEIRVESTPAGLYDGVRIIAELGVNTVLTDDYTSDAGPGRCWTKGRYWKSEGVSSLRFTIRAPEEQTGSTNWLLWKRANSDSTIIASGVLASGDVYQIDLEVGDDPTTEIWLETRGSLSGSAELQAITYPPQLSRDGHYMVHGGERDDLVAFIVDDGENWWDYAIGGNDPYEPQDGSGEKWWRGGQYHTPDGFLGIYVSRGAGMPAVLT